MKLRNWLLVSVALFAVAMVMGLLQWPGGLENLFEGDLLAMEELSSQLDFFSFTTFIIIFLKNLTSVCLSLLLSPVLLLVPLFSLLFNGWLLGYVVAVFAGEVSWAYVAAGLLPHGVLEIPALILGQAVALKAGVAVMTTLRGKSPDAALVQTLKGLVPCLLVVVALLLVAALLETFVTPLLLESFA